jgi:hypothetical protein
MNNPKLSNWPQIVGDFVAANIPGDASGDWDHAFISAYQMGCELLESVGLATETHRGATPIAREHAPPDRPRWDDACVVAIKLATQIGQIRFRPTVDTSSGAGLDHVFISTRAVPTPVMIADGPGTAPADATPEVVDLLKGLGLISAGRWTTAAETILWRAWPYEWGSTGFLEDHRFLAAVDHAVATMPEFVRGEVLRLMTVSEETVAMAARRSGRAPSAIRETLQRVQDNDLDLLFFRCWRLGEGWLPDPRQGRLLEVFHDDLAQAVRSAVVTNLRDI